MRAHVFEGFYDLFSWRRSVIFSVIGSYLHREGLLDDERINKAFRRGAIEAVIRMAGIPRETALVVQGSPPTNTLDIEAAQLGLCAWWGNTNHSLRMVSVLHFKEALRLCVFLFDYFASIYGGNIPQEATTAFDTVKYFLATGDGKAVARSSLLSGIASDSFYDDNISRYLCLAGELLNETDNLDGVVYYLREVLFMIEPDFSLSEVMRTIPCPDVLNVYRQG